MRETPKNREENTPLFKTLVENYRDNVRGSIQILAETADAEEFHLNATGAGVFTKTGITKVTSRTGFETAL